MSDGLLTAPRTLPPRPRLKGIIESYMRNQLPRDIHPAFKAIRDHEETSSTPTQIPLSAAQVGLGYVDTTIQSPGNQSLNPDDDNLLLEELYKDAESERMTFKLALESYEKTTAGSKFKTDVTSKSVHTWEEVLEEINKASKIYINTPGLWGKIRRAFRRFGQHNQAFTGWIGLLPSDSEYNLFFAAARLHDLREEVCDVLAEIPTLLASTHRALGVFRKSKDLHERSSGLYVATIAALHQMVSFYQEKAYKKITKSLFKQGSYGDDLKEAIKALKLQSISFEKSATLCLYETSVNTNQEVKFGRIESRMNHAVLIGALNQSYQQIDGLKQEILTIRENMRDDMQGVLAKFLSSNSRIDYKIRDARAPMLPLRKVASESRLIKDRVHAQEELLVALDYEDTVIVRDVKASLRGIWALPLPDQDRVVAIMQSPKLHRWISETCSAALFINANCKGSRRQQSSFVPAKLFDSIQKSRERPQGKSTNAIGLVFFCGEHLGSQDPDTGVGGMIRSLISQLLLVYPDFDLRCIDRMHSIDYNHVEDLCELFRLLISQLPPHMSVFCVIDSISFFEENEILRDESDVAVQEFLDIVENTQRYWCTFKLLLTSPWKSRFLYKSLPYQDRDVIWMPTKVTPQGGFTGMKWDTNVTI
ncbi:hypothetical protein BJ875DRAFT_500410 [Amylocarpus encephaloides]|uniref:Uncharacterized protein n=1 Tax=Amylocarpus encephaloides TaxID=45428 RepID=A0A9P8C0H0_9HELO|nr:hypothetical protein BJ875DRAFT_500410 [Amylocarpus encephaloides]